MPDINLFFWLTLTALAALAAVILAAEKKAEAAAVKELQHLADAVCRTGNARRQSPQGRAAAAGIQASSGAARMQQRQVRPHKSHVAFFPVADSCSPAGAERSAHAGLQYELPRLAGSCRQPEKAESPRQPEKKKAAVASCHHCA